MPAQFTEEPSGDLRRVEPARSTPDQTGRNNWSETIGIDHWDGLYAYALVLTGSQMQAENLVQETYVHMLETINRSSESSNIKGCFFTILRSLWLKELPRSQDVPPCAEMDFGSIPAERLVGHAKGSHEVLTSREHVEGVRAAIEKLPLELREIILLREFEEFSYCEIAGVLGCPVGVVITRLGRARAQLRSLLLPRGRTFCCSEIEDAS